MYRLQWSWDLKIWRFQRVMSMELECDYRNDSFQTMRV